MTTKHFTPWILGIILLAVPAGLATSWASTQEPPKVERVGKKKRRTVREQDKATRAHQRLLAMKRTLPALKTTLSEAVGLAEKQLSGKAFSASLGTTKTGESYFEVELLAGDKLVVTRVDPETKVVQVEGKDDQKDDQDDSGAEKQDAGGEGD